MAEAAASLKGPPQHESCIQVWDGKLPPDKPDDVFPGSEGMPKLQRGIRTHRETRDKLAGHGGSG